MHAAELVAPLFTEYVPLEQAIVVHIIVVHKGGVAIVIMNNTRLHTKNLCI